MEWAGIDDAAAGVAFDTGTAGTAAARDQVDIAFRIIMGVNIDAGRGW